MKLKRWIWQQKVRLDTIERLLGLTVVGMESYKKKSMSSNERTERSNHARRAMSWAAESVCLKLYKEAQLWARRFIRDPVSYQCTLLKFMG